MMTRKQKYGLRRAEGALNFDIARTRFGALFPECT